MENENWYRQLFALTLLSVARAAVEWITNPGSREEATGQLKGAFQDIDYDAAARAVTNLIDGLADSSKARVNETIDTLRQRGHGAVDEAKSRAEEKLGQKKGGRKRRFFIGLVLGGIIAYFLMDEQRRDDLLDRMTGASGPIQQTTQSVVDQATTTAQQAASRVTGTSGSTSPAPGDSAADTTPDNPAV